MKKNLKLRVDHYHHACLSLHQGVKSVDPCTNKNFQFQEMVSNKDLTNHIVKKRYIHSIYRYQIKVRSDVRYHSLYLLKVIARMMVSCIANCCFE